MVQIKYPNRQVFVAGDCISFMLQNLPTVAGKAYLRTTIGGADAERSEAIALAEHGDAKTGMAWQDLEMIADEHGNYKLTLPLTEVGVFEAKCFFAPENDDKLLWPNGDNWVIKVQNANNLCANNIYCAFVRQFSAQASSQSKSCQDEVAKLDSAGYTVIPPSGTFRDLKGELDHIFNDLGCRILQLLPIHPTPTSYGRMGRYGSPFASLDYFAVDPALAEFDVKATPMEQFVELVDAVHARRGRILLDIPVNHTGWASKVQNDHPEYFVRREDGTFESPGAWGVVWEDLCKLNYRAPEVFGMMAEVFLHWCRVGVDGFRCDAGYMLPAEAWNYIVAKVRSEYPDTLFLLEGLGGKISVQEELLSRSGLDWAYSELFQNYSRDEISHYQPYMEQCSHNFGALVSFAETHDNTRLAAQSPTYAAMRCALSALLSCGGAFGFANGVEFFATERIDVHGNGDLNWGATPNLIGLIQRLNKLLGWHNAFFANSRVELIQHGPGNLVVAERTGANREKIWVAVNLDTVDYARAYVPFEKLQYDKLFDLLTGKEVPLIRETSSVGFDLAPGEALCLSCSAEEMMQFEAYSSNNEPVAVTEQRAKALGFMLWSYWGNSALPEFDMAHSLCQDPMAFCQKAAGSDLPSVARYNVDWDFNRIVMLATGDILLTESLHSFRIEIYEADRVVGLGVSISKSDSSGEFTFIKIAPNESTEPKMLKVKLSLFDVSRGNLHFEGTLMQMPKEIGVTDFRLKYNAQEVAERNLHAFCANDRGGMVLTSGAWGTLFSKYDALLAGNGSAPYPVDRRIMLSRLRGWLVADEYSQELNLSVLNSFAVDCNNRAEWSFVVPSGRGRLIPLKIALEGAIDGDAIKLRVTRECKGDASDLSEVKIIFRPDVENRTNHQLTKAFGGPEYDYPNAVDCFGSGFRFAPTDLELTMQLSKGTFVKEPEWNYMVELPLERYYGQEYATDLFSPGFMEIELGSGESTELVATIAPKGESREYCWPATQEIPESQVQLEALKQSMRAFVVKRDKFNTVIAGYPWFLDWGRDTLIALRGLISGGYKDIAKSILRQFASFEERGTIPNIIHGGEVGNRDTSDAPLWLSVAVRDYVDFYNDDSILDEDCSGRPFREVLRSIAENYLKGTPNGIKVDPQSMLVFSPSHFTWMDTNYPAGTPREGYPIEIQALWHAAVEFLGRDEEKYRAIAVQVCDSLVKYFYLPNKGRFSDCLHCHADEGAAVAVADDHIRCNQLLALTLGAVQDRAMQLAILTSAEELIIPGSIRSLSTRKVDYELPIYHNGVRLNAPDSPYWGRYCGPEDTCRKAAYHNGTAWGWVFPSYSEGLFMVGGAGVAKRALSLLESVGYMANSYVPGQLAEVADGDAPHVSGGCPAQAWSVTEAYRVMRLIVSKS